MGWRGCTRRGLTLNGVKAGSAVADPAGGFGVSTMVGAQSCRSVWSGSRLGGNRFRAVGMPQATGGVGRPGHRSRHGGGGGVAVVVSGGAGRGTERRGTGSTVAAPGGAPPAAAMTAAMAPTPVAASAVAGSEGVRSQNEEADGQSARESSEPMTCSGDERRASLSGIHGNLVVNWRCVGAEPSGPRGPLLQAPDQRVLIIV